MMIKKSMMMLAFAAFAAGSALAQEEPPVSVKIKGNTTINANAQDITTTANGKNARAVTDNGTISDSTINGNTTINANAKGVTTSASGKDSQAYTQNGAIEQANIEGNTQISANLQNSTTSATGQGACAATRNGVIGPRKC